MKYLTSIIMFALALCVPIEGTCLLKESTSIDIRMGPFVDVGDGFTPETGVTIGASDEAEVLKANGAATVAMSGAFAAVANADGWYDYTVATGDVDTVGEVVFAMNDDSVYLPVFVRCYVIETNIYAALFESGSAAFDASDDVTVGSVVADAINAAAIADNAIDDATFAADTDGYWVAGLGVIITATETKIGFHWKDNNVIAPLDAGDTTITCTDTADAVVFTSADDGEYGTSNVFHETYAGVFADGEPVSCIFVATIDALSRTDGFVITKTGGDVDITRIGGSQNTIF